MTTEIDRLNRIGAEIMGWKRIERDKYYPDDDLDYWGSEKEYYYSIKDWSPATDLNHTDMVEQEMVGKRWHIQIIFGLNHDDRWEVVLNNSTINYNLYLGYAPINQKALAVMRAIDKAWEGGK